MTLDEFLRNEVKEICKKVKLTGFRNKKILILGSNSFFGSYLALVLNYANKFYNINCNITCVSKNNPNERLKNLRKEKKIKFIKKDITNKNFIKNILKKDFNYIYHTATYGQPAKWKSNELELLNLNTIVVNDILDNIKYSNSKFIYFSSCDVYGSTGRVIANEESPLKFDINSSRSNYAISKVMGERLCEYHRKKFGTKSIILRPGHTFGVGLEEGQSWAEQFAAMTDQRLLRWWNLGQPGASCESIIRILHGAEKVLFPKHIVICWPAINRREKVDIYTTNLTGQEPELKYENKETDTQNFLKCVFFDHLRAEVYYHYHLNNFESI